MPNEQDLERNRLFNAVMDQFKRDPEGATETQDFEQLLGLMNGSRQNLIDHLHEMKAEWMGDYVRIADHRRRRDPSPVNEEAYERIARMHYGGEELPETEHTPAAKALITEWLGF